MSMCLRTSITGKLLLLLSMFLQGIMMRRLCYDFINRLTGLPSDQDEQLTQPERAVATSSQSQPLQMDILVPAFERDELLTQFAHHLGTAIENYNHHNPKSSDDDRIPSITTFRLLVTRFGRERADSMSQALRQELVTATGLSEENVVLVLAEDGVPFSRARALNLLHDAACHFDHCLVTRLDVDIVVQEEFFTHSVEIVHQNQLPPLDDYNQEFLSPNSQFPNTNTPLVYFPIVWSQYNPESVVLVEDHLRNKFQKDGKGAVEERLKATMPQHRGHWRPYGKGMYVLLGSDAAQFKFNPKYEGWGGEDVDFYNQTAAARRIARRMEPGLIHTWHNKICSGKEAATSKQAKNCMASLVKEAGSDLGRYLMFNARKAKQEEVQTPKQQQVSEQQTIDYQHIVTRKPVDPNEVVDLEMDVMVPVYERDDRLRTFASNMGKAVENYQKQQHQGPRITTFRLLVTRFSPEEIRESDDFRQELSLLTGLPINNIIMVQAEGTAFSRARALNLLHNAACHRETCLITRLDVDMEVRAEFFEHSIETVYLQQVPPLDEFNQEFRESPLPQGTPTAYFPIVWSAYNPDSVQAVEEHFGEQLRNENPDNIQERLLEKMPEYSEHRGHWRPYGKGMYVILGTDATILQFNTQYEGWGSEDVDFYNKTVALPRRILRGIETGLIHTWHPKFCDKGKDAFTPQQIKNCKRSVKLEEGSPLGQELLALKTPGGGTTSNNLSSSAKSQQREPVRYYKKDGKVYLVKKDYATQAKESKEVVPASTIQERKVYWLPPEEVRKDGFSASWLQKTEDFLTMELDKIVFCEEASFKADRLTKLRMSLDWLDFSLEHLSKWWKMLRIFETIEVYNTAIQRFDQYLSRADSYPLENESSFQDTIAVIAYRAYRDENEPQQAYTLTVKSLAATMESLRRAGFGRIVVVGDGPKDPEITQDTFRQWKRFVEPDAVVDDQTIVTQVGHVQVGYAIFDVKDAVTEHVEKNIPRATLFGLKHAFDIGKQKKEERNAEDQAYLERWLGDKEWYSYVYLTEPDSILQTRPSTLVQLKEELDKGMVLVPHRLQPIPHEADARGSPLDFSYLPENKFPVLELDAIGGNDSCCDVNRGPEYKPGAPPMFESCGTFWYLCDFMKKTPPEER
jgi:Chondroitin N-acetylgalactosaminyltransferase